MVGGKVRVLKLENKSKVRRQKKKGNANCPRILVLRKIIKVQSCEISHLGGKF
jgi:hypothetical protein